MASSVKPAASAPHSAPAATPAVVFFTDFGIDSGLASSMHGVCRIVDPALVLHDGSHCLPAFNIRAASAVLEYTVGYWPSGTIFVSVVDPGVGTDRKASVAKLGNGSFIVTPDNGTLTLVERRFGIDEIRVIDETCNRFPAAEKVSVFHGRDLFAYTAARLAAGVISFNEVGESYPVSEIVRHEVWPFAVNDHEATGYICGMDPFGTVETSIENAAIERSWFVLGEPVHITISENEGDGSEPATIFDGPVLFAESFGFVEPGDPVVFRDLAFRLSIGLNLGNFAERYQMLDTLAAGGVYRVTIRPVSASVPSRSVSD